MKITNQAAIDSIRLDFPDASDFEIEFICQNADYLCVSILHAHDIQAKSECAKTFIKHHSERINQLESAHDELSTILSPLIKAIAGEKYTFDTIGWMDANRARVYVQKWYRGEVDGSFVFTIYFKENESFDELTNRMISEKIEKDNLARSKELERETVDKIKRINELATELGMRIVK